MQRLHQRSPVVLALVLVLVTARAWAQPSVRVDVGHAFDNITFGGESADDDRGATSIFLDAEHLALDDRLRLAYVLDLDSFSTPGDWLLLNQAGGATWRHGFGDGRAHRLHAGGLLTVRHNGDAWNTGGFRALSGFVNVELHPSATRAFRAGYQADRRVFPGVSALDQTQHQGFASALVNLPSRTTLIGEVTVGAKRYDGWPATDTPEASPLVGPSATAPVGSAFGPSGQGRGSLVGQSTAVDWLPSAGVTMSDAGSPPTTAYLVTVFGRVAQSLATRTGFSLDVIERRTSGNVPEIIVDTPARFFDDGVYDDPFASDATTLKAELKHVWPSLAQLSGQGAWFDRRYRSTPAYGADGLPLADGTLRHDDVWWIRVEGRMPVLQERTGSWIVTLVASYDYVHHRSTDAFYRYDSHAIGIGASVAY